jgi:RimJ/RimL family protein N-acetyltransferase
MVSRSANGVRRLPPDPVSHDTVGMTMIEGDKLPVLTSERVVLRWLEDRDADALFGVFSDPQVMCYWSSPPWTDQARSAEMIESVGRYFAEGALYQWGIARRSDDTVIGTCTLAHVDTQNRRAEIGFILRRDHWGQGYMSEATRALLRFAFEKLDLHRVEADVDPRNEASIRLLERLGFQREGYLRERWIVGDEINDTILYGLLRREWLSA